MACEIIDVLRELIPDDLYFVVPTSGGEYIDAGGQIILLPARFNGWKLRVFRTNVLLDFEDQGQGDPYWTKAGNTVVLSVDASELEKFAIFAYKPE